MNPLINRSGALVLGAALFFGLAGLGYQLGSAAVQVKAFERSVTVKGLSEHKYPADIVIWPVQFTVADNDLAGLYAQIEDGTGKVRAFLALNGIDPAEISVSAPEITDKSAQRYGDAGQAPFRFTATQTVTVYSPQIDPVRAAMGNLGELGKQGIALGGGDFQAAPEYLFTRLNAVKPQMIEEATRQAREVAEKFAADSQSSLGKIRKASQGQFSIEPRDTNNPHIKRVRVVSTVEYYLSD